MSEQLSDRGKDLVKYMPQAVNALADRLIEKITERVLYGEKPQTNADRIRGMTDEELAEEMSERLSEDCLMCPVLKADCPVWEAKEVECKTAMLNWLKAPVEEATI